MHSGKQAHQRLVTLVTALLGIALLYLAFADIALAEDASPPACSAKIPPSMA